MNKIIISGNITKDVELQTLGSGTELAKFTVAVNRKLKKIDGTTDTDFFQCTAFGKLATEVIAKYGKKGQKVLVSGRMESSTKDKDGNKTTYWNVLVEEFELVGGKAADSDNKKRTSVQAVDDDDNIPF